MNELTYPFRAVLEKNGFEVEVDNEVLQLRLHRMDHNEMFSIIRDIFIKTYPNSKYKLVHAVMRKDPMFVYFKIV